MKNLIKFELIKAYNNTLHIALIVVMIIILLTSMLFSLITIQETYITKQQNNASIILKTDSGLSSEAISYYRDIVQSNSWQSIYQIYNEIDSLNEGLETDLNYDTKTNIEYRNYNLNYKIDPDSDTGANYIIRIYDSYLQYIVIGIFIILSLNIIISEYQENTDNYLFCLSYSYQEIFLSKLVVNLFVVFVTIILPIFIFYLIYSFSHGFTNPHTIFESNPIYCNVIINTHSFITVNSLLLLKLVEMIMYCLVIHFVTFLSIYYSRVKNR